MISRKITDVIFVMIVFLLFGLLVFAANLHHKTVTVTGVLKSADAVGGFVNKEYDFVFEDGTHCRLWNDHYPFYIGHKIRIEYIVSNGAIEDMEDLGEASK